MHKILRLFANTLTVDDKHYLLNRDNLTQSIPVQLYQKQRQFSEFFSSISKIYMKVETFPKKRSPSWQIYFPKYRLGKTWLDKCLKNRLSEDP